MADKEEAPELPKVLPEEVSIGRVYDDVPGVKPEVVAKIAKMLEKGRRYFGSSGASLTHQVHNLDKSSGIKPELAKVGLEGERDTTVMLRKWMEDKPSVVLVDSVHINMDYKIAELEEPEIQEEVDEETGVKDGKDTDHVLLIGNEVILVDTKRWKSKRGYSIGDNGQVLRTRKPFPGGNVRMRQAIYLWAEYLYDGAILNGIVHLNSEDVTVTRNRNWYTQQYRLVEKERFIDFLDEKWRRTNPTDRTTINPNLVAQIALSAIKPFDEYGKVFNLKTLNEFRKK